MLATGNAGKLREIREMLAEFGPEIVAQSELGVPPADETGGSFAENALLKARHAAAHTGLPAIADDSGLCVDALGGRPGVHSARYAGPGASDRQNLDLLLNEIEHLGVERPSASFHCAMAYVEANDDPDPLLVEASWQGHIVTTPAGENGFGYDPVFYVPTHGCTSAQLAPEVKNRISHRALALRALVAALRRRFGGIGAERP